MKKKNTDSERNWWRALMLFNVVLYTVLAVQYVNVYW